MIEQRSHPSPLLELELDKFKPFGRSQRLPIRPITLIYGQNSAGKSSIIQAVLLLKQTLEDTQNPGIPLLPRGSLVDLGSFSELAYGHRRGSSVSFRFTFGAVSERGTRSGILTLTEPPHGIGLTFGGEPGGRSIGVQRLDIYSGHSPDLLISYEPAPRDEGDGAENAAHADPFAGRLFRVAKSNYEHPIWHELWKTQQRAGETEGGTLRLELAQWRELVAALEVDPNPSSQRHYEEARKELARLEERHDSRGRLTWKAALQDFERTNQATRIRCRNFVPIGAHRTLVTDPVSGEYFQVGRTSQLDVSRLAVIIGQELRSWLGRVSYLGPLRDYPERLYIYTGVRPRGVGKAGDDAPHLLYADHALLSRVNETIRSFELGYTLEMRSADNADELGDVYAIRLRDSTSKVSVSLRDVGFGISQLLPLVVESLLGRRRVLCVEQPEIHLHPRLQTNLADLLADGIRPPFRNAFIVETHSEHLLLRLQRLIRLGKLRSTDVSVVYVERGVDGSRIVQLRLDASGDLIDPWPGGFFEEGFAEMFDLSARP